MDCPVCGAGSRAKLRKGGVDIVECRGCGLAWWVPEAGLRAEALYDATYFADTGTNLGYDDYGALESSLRATFERRMADLPRPAPGERLLDVGAAYGFGVAEARRAGWQATGLEISRAAARRAGREAAGRLIVGDALRTPFPAQSFTLVTLWDVLEHLSDPHAAIAEVARVLRDGGRLVLTTGDVGSAVARLSGRRWHLYNLPEHLFFYTRRSLDVLLAAHGLRIESVRADAAVFTLGYLVERLRKSLLGRRARGPAHWPGSRLRVPVNLFDVMTARAVRTGA
jgi:SAM-dependent methyltransferase